MREVENMRKMKDSGVEWIGEIPEDWDVVRLKSLFTNGKGLPITKENLVESGLPVISYGQIHAKYNTGVSLTPELIRYVDEKYLETNPSSLVDEGDFIFADTSEDLAGCGNCAYVDTSSSLFAGYHTIILKQRKKQNNKYLAYLFLTDPWRSQIRSKVSGVKLFSISKKILMDTMVILPPITIQSKIVSYLDSQCSEIDTTLDKIKLSIEEYKLLKQSVITQSVTKGIHSDRPLKESGVEWVKTIPENIPITRVGLQYDIILGKMLCSEKPNDTYTLEPYYCAIDIHFDGVSTATERKRMWFNQSEKESYLVHNGDLLVVEGGAGAGGCAIVDSQTEDTYVQNSIMIVRDKGKCDVKYLRYWIECLVKKGYIDVVCNKATIPHFTKDKLATMPFLLFSLEEQQEITAYLDQKCREIDDIISQKQKLIEELQTYKKSLIYEYVTGKKEPPANPQPAEA